MRNVASESKKVYVGFDVSEKTIETFAVCGTETSKGSFKIDNNKVSIRKLLEFECSGGTPPPSGGGSSSGRMEFCANSIILSFNDITTSWGKRFRKCVSSEALKGAFVWKLLKPRKY